jgi:hypothetical protein
MALFSAMTFIGLALGTVISGFLQLKEDWQWNFYVLPWLHVGNTLPEIVNGCGSFVATALCIDDDVTGWSSPSLLLCNFTTSPSSL